MKNGLTKSDIMLLWHTLNEINMELPFPVSYAFARTKRLIKDEVESMVEASKPSADYLDYEHKRIELCNRLAKKDEHDKPIISGNEYIFDNPHKFRKEMEKLTKDSQTILYLRDNQIVAYNKALDEPVDSQLFKVKASQMPKSFMSRYVDGLYPMIDYDLSNEESLSPELKQDE